MKKRRIRKQPSVYVGKAAILLYSVFVFLPLYVLITTALKTDKEIYTNPVGLPVAPQWENFLVAIEKGKILQYALNSILVTVIAVVLIVILQTLCSYGLYQLRTTRLGKVLYNICIAGLMIPTVGYSSLILLYRNVHLYNTRAALVVASVASSLPFATMVLVGHMKQVPGELLDAARVDGCSSFKILTKIMVPVITPAITSIGVLNLINVWNNMLTPLLLLSDSSNYTIPVGLLSFKGNYSTQYNYLFAGIIITAIPVLLLYFSSQKKFVESMTGSIKG